MPLVARVAISALVIATGVSAFVACIDTPHLQTYANRDGMVLVPAVMVPAIGVAPADMGGNGNGKGKGGPNADAGTPTPTPTPPSPTDPVATDAGDAATTPPTTAAPAPVLVAAFWLDAREVTAGAYRECLAAGGCTAPTLAPGCTLNDGLALHPVNCVTVDQSRAYCTWLGKRLVRNDEWSAAATGSTSRLYPWGADVPAADRLNACGPECAASGTTGMYAVSDGFVSTAPGGSFPLGRSPDGVDDLAGNVAEWVEGTSTARGGSFADIDASAVAAMSTRTSDAADPSIGFRCALDP